VDNGKTTATRVADPPAARKRNAVAHEAAVTVAGARPGESAGRRELFTENTTSVLVFENGGVIRLGTDVIVGQLLFLTHRESKREVVAQVTGKQRFHAGSPYIELEFTEAAPGFWDVEFPAKPLPEGAERPARPAARRTPDRPPTLAPAVATDPALTPAQTPEQTAALTPPAPTDSEAPATATAAPAAANAELLYVLEEPLEEAGEAPAARSAEEVGRLRQEVETLRVQLQSLKQGVGAEGSSGRGDGGGMGKAAEVPARSNGTRNELLDVNAPSEAPSTPVRAEEHREEPTQPGAKREFAAQDLLPAVALDFSRADDAIEQSVKAERKSGRKGARQTGKAGGGKTLRVALLAAVLLAAATGVAWYKHWLPQFGGAKASPWSAATPAPVAPANGGQKTSVSPADANSTAGTSQTAAAETVAGGKDAQSAVPATDAAPGAEAAAEPKTYRDPTRPTIREKAGNSRIVAGRGDVRAANKLEATEVSVIPEGGATVPPKLLQSVRAMPPPEAVRGFVTGNVNLDAVVDASGHVSSMKVLSGPAALRNAAMDALKRYKYEPAKQNGRAVSAHVNVTVQFWYEP
jgi:TonB family protein